MFLTEGNSSAGLSYVSATNNVRRKQFKHGSELQLCAAYYRKEEREKKGKY